MEYTDEQLEVANEWLESTDRVIAAATYRFHDSVGNVFCIAANTYAGGDGYPDYVAYAAHHCDTRTGDVYEIVSDVDYARAVDCVQLYREGKRY